MKVQAHRGVSSEAPENTLPAIKLAIAQGYQVIEVDPDVTKDHRIVLLHDHHLGRTARTADGERVKDGLQISDVTYDEALEYDYGLWFGEQFKGTKIHVGRQKHEDPREVRFSHSSHRRYAPYAHILRYGYR